MFYMDSHGRMVSSTEYILYTYTHMRARYRIAGIDRGSSDLFDLDSGTVGHGSDSSETRSIRQTSEEPIAGNIRVVHG